MAPSKVKTIRELICYQYAKIIAASAGFSKNDSSTYYKFVMDRMMKLASGNICMSEILRELKKQMSSSDHVCEYCGSKEDLSWDHIIPCSKGGSDNAENYILACKRCNSSKGNKGLYEWFGIDRKDDLPRIVAGKYLKILWKLHEQNGSLDSFGSVPNKKLDVLDLENIIHCTN